MTDTKNCTKSMFLQPHWPGNSVLMQMYMPCVFGYMYPDCMFRRTAPHSPCTYRLVLCRNLQSVLRTLWAGMVQPRFLYWCAQHSTTPNQYSHRLIWYMLNCMTNMSDMLYQTHSCLNWPLQFLVFLYRFHLMLYPMLNHWHTFCMLSRHTNMHSMPLQMHTPMV